MSVSVTEFIQGVGDWLVMPFYPLFVLALGASVTTLGILVLITGLLGVGFQGPAGYFSDLFGRKKVIVVAGFIAALAPFIMAFATTWEMLIPASVLSSFAQIVWPVRQTIVADSLHPHERGRGFATFFTIVFFPSAIMPTLSGMIVETLGIENGMRLILIVQGVMGSAATCGRILLIRETKSRTEKTEHALPGVTQFLSEMLEPLRTIRSFRIMLVGSCASMFTFGFLGAFSSVYAVDVIKISKTEWGIVSSATGLVNVLVRIPAGRITDRVGRRICILALYFARPIYVFLFTLSQNALHLLTIGIMNTFAFGVGIPAWQAMLTDTIPSSKRGRAYGTIGMIPGLFWAAAPTIGGTIWENISPDSSFYVASGFGLASAIFLAVYLKEPMHRED